MKTVHRRLAYTWMWGMLLSLTVAGCGTAGSDSWSTPFLSAETGSLPGVFGALDTGADLVKRRRFVFTGQTLVRVTYRTRAQVQELANSGLDIFYHRDNWLVAEVPAWLLSKLRARSDLRIETLSPRDGYTIQNNFDRGYHTYEAMTAEIQALANQQAQVVRLLSLGKSWEGTRDIWAMRISGPGDADKRPGVLFMGAHHAREIVTPEICLLLAHYLLDNYGKDAALTELVNTRDIWIVPMLNPDGHALAERGENWRKNTNNPNHDPLHGGPGGPGVDLNRNYGYKWGQSGSSGDAGSATYRGRSAFSEPETQSIRELFRQHRNIAMSMSYHSFSNLVLWPWGYTDDPAPDKAVFESIGKKIASFSGYTPEQGSELYITSGDSDDWIYGEMKSLPFTTEIGGWDDYFDPPFSSLPRFWDENRPGALYMIQVAANPKRIGDDIR